MKQDPHKENNGENVCIWHCVFLGKVDKFSYLGNMFDTDGECVSAVMERTVWKSYVSTYPVTILTGRGF